MCLVSFCGSLSCVPVLVHTKTIDAHHGMYISAHWLPFSLLMMCSPPFPQTEDRLYATQTTVALLNDRLRAVSGERDKFAALVESVGLFFFSSHEWGRGVVGLGGWCYSFRCTVREQKENVSCDLALVPPQHLWP